MQLNENTSVETRLPKERRELIIKRLSSDKLTTLNDLAEDQQVSRVTIQRDVKMLENEGLIERYHGGVRLLVTDKSNFETRFEARLNQNYDQKVEIAQNAVKGVKEGSTIFIDSSTTCNVFANEIFKQNFNDLTVITNSPTIVNDAPKDTNIQIISTGGLLRLNFNMFYGYFVINFLKNINIDTAFISCAGLSVLDGISSSDIELTNVLKTVFERSSEINVLADSSKFNKKGLLVISSIDCCNKIFTDSMINKSIIKEFKSLENIKLIV